MSTFTEDPLTGQPIQPLRGVTTTGASWVSPDADPFAGKTIEDVVAFCRSAGVTRLDWRGIHMDFGPLPTAPVDPQKFAEALQSGVPGDVELLGWSAGGDFAADVAAIQKTFGGES